MNTQTKLSALLEALGDPELPHLTEIAFLTGDPNSRNLDAVAKMFITIRELCRLGKRANDYSYTENRQALQCQVCKVDLMRERHHGWCPILKAYLFVRQQAASPDEPDSVVEELSEEQKLHEVYSYALKRGFQIVERDYSGPLELGYQQVGVVEQTKEQKESPEQKKTAKKTLPVSLPLAAKR